MFSNKILDKIMSWIKPINKVSQIILNLKLNELIKEEKRLLAQLINERI